MVGTDTEAMEELAGLLPMAGSAYFLVLPKINYPGLASPPSGLSPLTSILIKKLSHRLAEVPLHMDDSSLCSVCVNYKLTSICLSFPRVQKVGTKYGSCNLQMHTEF